MPLAHDFVLVRAADRRVVGIVTATDLGPQFQQLAEPFLLLGEIENHLRRVLSGCFTPDDLAAMQDPADPARKIATAADLTFGEYRRLFEEPGRWACTKLPIDRGVLLERLERIRIIRNDVMHSTRTALRLTISRCCATSRVFSAPCRLSEWLEGEPPRRSEVDYRNIPWRNSRFDEEELTRHVATQSRARNAHERLQKRGGTRTLAFCVSQRHADFMADFFRQQGLRAVAVPLGRQGSISSTVVGMSLTLSARSVSRRLDSPGPIGAG